MVQHIVRVARNGAAMRASSSLSAASRVGAAL
jgi:hypothetical protein